MVILTLVVNIANELFWWHCTVIVLATKSINTEPFLHSPQQRHIQHLSAQRTMSTHLSRPASSLCLLSAGFTKTSLITLRSVWLALWENTVCDRHCGTQFPSRVWSVHYHLWLVQLISELCICALFDGVICRFSSHPMWEKFQWQSVFVDTSIWTAQSEHPVSSVSDQSFQRLYLPLYWLIEGLFLCCAPCFEF